MTDYFMDPGSPPAAAPLHRRRGRPKSNHARNDTGTAELVMKRLQGETTEALDLCMERSLIDRNQHWCGIHLRWLYTLRFGAPGIRAIDTTHLGGMDIATDDPQWAQACEQEYQEAMALLVRTGHAAAVTSICIYNERPAFLRNPATLSALNAARHSDALTHLVEGLDILVRHWAR